MESVLITLLIPINTHKDKITQGYKELHHSHHLTAIKREGILQNVVLKL